MVTLGTSFWIKIKGDLNSDGKTSITDAILSFRAAAGKINLDYYEKYAADIDGNDIADITDAMLLIMNIAGRNWFIYILISSN